MIQANTESQARPCSEAPPKKQFSSLKWPKGLLLAPTFAWLLLPVKQFCIDQGRGHNPPGSIRLVIIADNAHVTPLITTKIHFLCYYNLAVREKSPS